jgi:RNA polymerase sigma-70 factor (ECF subfamily)
MQKKIHKKLEKMFLEHYDEWCLISFTYLQSMNEAEEVVQDVCVNILLKNRSLKILNLNAYIARAVRNRSLKSLKRRGKFETLNNINIPTSPSSEKVIIHNERKLRLQKAVESLPDPSKKVFKLCVLEGQKYQNAADTMGISVNTVKYHVKKAYKTLRIEIEDIYLSIIIISTFALFITNF